MNPEKCKLAEDEIAYMLEHTIISHPTPTGVHPVF